MEPFVAGHLFHIKKTWTAPFGQKSPEVFRVRVCYASIITSFCFTILKSVKYLNVKWLNKKIITITDYYPPLVVYDIVSFLLFLGYAMPNILMLTQRVDAGKVPIFMGASNCVALYIVTVATDRASFLFPGCARMARNTRLQYTQLCVQCTVYSVQFTVYSVHCTLYTVHCTLYTVHCTLYTVHYTLYTVHSTLYTVHCTLYSLQGLLGRPCCSTLNHVYSSV